MRSVKVYLDNAATTRPDPAVIAVMSETLEKTYGNPSSTHAFGIEARALIEKARKSIASLLHVSPAEIFFTSGGTEANNTALFCSVRDLGIKHIITSRIEHHAVLHTVEELAKNVGVEVSYVKLLPNGHVDLENLEHLLATHEKTLVSLMHANNEISNILPLEKVSQLCEQYQALFHSDTVQTMGHYPLHLQETKVDFVSCAGHKFHGPKGIGFLYINSKSRIRPFIFGGAQERNMRGGTENIYGIVGLAKAFELAHADMEIHHAHIQELKTYMIQQLRMHIPAVAFNGDAENQSLYTVLNVSLPETDMAEMLLFKLDIEGIAASGGSACSSGTSIGSHVLKAIQVNPQRPSVRFSFSKYNSKEDIDFCIEKLKEIYKSKVLV